MAKKVFSLPSLALLLLLFIFPSGGIVKWANGQEMKTRCIAKPSSSEAELAANIDFACRQVQGGCKLIQEGGPCINHASVVAMNLYYQFMGRNYRNCDFRGSGLLTITDPSYGSCRYHA